MPDFKPILFNTAMVKAILEGRKTQTRRIIKPQPTNPRWNNVGWLGWDDGHGYRMKPPCMAGDVLWVRETWCKDVGRYMYRANYSDDEKFYQNGKEVELAWHPSIHMPKEAARIFLRVKDVWVERLQDIGYFDSLSEGIAHLYDNLSDAEYESWASRSGYHRKKKSEWPYINYLWHGHFGSCGTGNRISDAWPYQFSSYEDPCGSFSSLWNSTVDLKDWEKYGWDANPWVWAIRFERIEKPAHWFLGVDKS